MIKLLYNNLLLKYTDNFTLINELYADIEKKYSSPNRYYHNLKHIIKMLNTIKQSENSELLTDNIYFAVWYHDIIYNTLRKDNEKRSADFAGEVINYTGLSHNNTNCYLHNSLAN